MTHPIARACFAFASIAALASCNAAPQEPFAGTQVPPGFTFRATRPVAISITESAALDAAGARTLELRTPDEGVLYAGGISNGQPLALNLAVATRHDHLVAVLSPGAPTEQRFTVPIQAVDGAARGALELR